MKHWDIFCKIVDNFGDIGVCWRLAKQLHSEHDINICLWIDDLTVAQQLIPGLNPALHSQHIENIHIRDWQLHSEFQQAAEVVIETFGCELPEPYQALMQPETVWVNLEYLSAESWVADFHSRHSTRGKLSRHFFFPGFNAGTGGLLREQNVFENNQQMAHSAMQQQALCDRVGIPFPAADILKISLFCYTNAPIHALLNALTNGVQATECYVPATGILPTVAAFFGTGDLATGEVRSQGNLTLRVLPFLSQADYDKLLAFCDINFVRGEDSWIRAVWAGKPFIWQPYWQTENTHITKLKAFMKKHYADADKCSREANRALYLAWSEGNLETPVWENYLQQLSFLQSLHLKQSQQLAALPDLASNLVIFIENLSANKI